MCLALGVLAPGGDLIIVSENSEGLGSSEFRDSQKNLSEVRDRSSFQRRFSGLFLGSFGSRWAIFFGAQVGNEKFLEQVLAKSHADIDEWETEMLLRAKRASGGDGNIHMWSPGLVRRDFDPAFQSEMQPAVSLSVHGVPAFLFWISLRSLTFGRVFAERRGLDVNLR